MLDPSAQPRLIKPIRPHRPKNRLFAPKELSIRVMNALREAEGGSLTIEAIVQRIMAEKGLSAPAGRMIQGVVAITLKGLRKRGVVIVSDDAPAHWSVKP
jgi:hypothetical protein